MNSGSNVMASTGTHTAAAHVAANTSTTVNTNSKKPIKANADEAFENFRMMQKERVCVDERDQTVVGLVLSLSLSNRNEY
jgi:hypothetical protein